MRCPESPAGVNCSPASACQEDAELVSRVLKGETGVFEQIVLRHQDSVYGLARRLLGEIPDAEDAAQEVFLRAYRGLQGFENRSKLSTWLFRIAYNICIDRLRSRRPAEALEEGAWATEGNADPESLALSAEERRALRRAVNGLRDVYREVIVLKYYQSLSAEEIAAASGVSPRTVETRLYRARKALRAKLGAPATRPDARPCSCATLSTRTS